MTTTVVITETLLKPSVTPSQSTSTITITQHATETPAPEASTLPWPYPMPSNLEDLAALLSGQSHQLPPLMQPHYLGASRSARDLSAPGAVLSLLTVAAMYWAFKHLRSDEWREWKVVRWWMAVSLPHKAIAGPDFAKLNKPSSTRASSVGRPRPGWSLPWTLFQRFASKCRSICLSCRHHRF